ncbi:MAG: hypothetical protein ACM3PB_00435 [Betaproteobacteria bacterium]
MPAPHTQKIVRCLSPASVLIKTMSTASEERISSAVDNHDFPALYFSVPFNGIFQ